MQPGVKQDGRVSPSLANEIRFQLRIGTEPAAILEKVRVTLEGELPEEKFWQVLYGCTVDLDDSDRDDEAEFNRAFLELEGDPPSLILERAFRRTGLSPGDGPLPFIRAVRTIHDLGATLCLQQMASEIAYLVFHPELNFELQEHDWP